MILSLPREELLEYVITHIKTFFPDGKYDLKEIRQYGDLALQRTEYCFSKVNSRYFTDGNNILFNHLNADQYAMFLYFLSNTLYKNQANPIVCTKLFQLNRYLHGIDVYFEVELPNIFLFVHSIGTVLGRARYSDYFVAYQGCNVGGSANQENQLVYPILDEFVTMHPGTSILGNCVVGKNSTLAAGSMLLNQDLTVDSLYIGNPRDYIIKKRERKYYGWKLE